MKINNHKKYRCWRGTMCISAKYLDLLWNVISTISEANGHSNGTCYHIHYCPYAFVYTMSIKNSLYFTYAGSAVRTVLEPSFVQGTWFCIIGTREACIHQEHTASWMEVGFMGSFSWGRSWRNCSNCFFFFFFFEGGGWSLLVLALAYVILFLSQIFVRGLELLYCTPPPPDIPCLP